MAFDRFDELLTRFPGVGGLDTSVGDMLTQWRLACSDQDQDALSVTIPPGLQARAESLPRAAPNSPLADRDLMMMFEGLGDRCEFGLVQRHFGAEPLSLLRWSVIQPMALAALLRSRFEGVGSPENVYLHIVRDEYFAGDRRFFTMHTFTQVHEISENRMLEMATKRMRFLKGKLLEDLDAGEKLFVYKRHGSAMTAEEQAAVASAMAEHYPKSALLLVHKAPQPSDAGKLEKRGPRLYQGFLDRIDLPPQHISYAVWNALCRQAYSDWRAHRT